MYRHATKAKHHILKSVYHILSTLKQCGRAEASAVVAVSYSSRPVRTLSTPRSPGTRAPWSPSESDRGHSGRSPCHQFQNRLPFSWCPEGLQGHNIDRLCLWGGLGSGRDRTGEGKVTRKKWEIQRDKEREREA